MCALKLIALLLLFSISTTARAEKLADLSPVEGWEVEARASNKTGEFSHCIASAPYKNGTYFFVTINKNYVWNLSFANPKWSLTEGNKIAVSIKIDRTPWQELDAVAAGRESIFITLPQGDDLINLFRFGRVLELFSAAGKYEFELSGTSRLLPVLAKCVQDYEKTNIAVSTPKSNAKEPTNEVAQPKSENESHSSTGTGVVVSANGILLTNNHVVEGCKTIEYTSEGDLFRSASLLRRDETNDLAILKSEKTYSPEQIAIIRNHPSVKAGESIAVYGFPLAGVLSISGNIVSGSISSLAGLNDDVRYFQISAPVQPGNSGGPLLDNSGNVIGIVNARINDKVVVDVTGAIPQNINFSIKSNVVTSFLETHAVEFSTSSSLAPVELSTIAERAKKFTVLIYCQR